MLALTVALASGCSVVAPKYAVSIHNIENLKRTGDISATVGKFDSIPSSDNRSPIPIRGVVLTSPYDGSFGKYIEEAIKLEFMFAEKLNPDSNIEISGVLKKNNIDAAGISTGRGDVTVDFFVRRGEVIRYHRDKTIHHEWPSSFTGATAIANAITEYNVMVERLLSKLYADTDFIEALKQP
jgi:hypothetical protein